MLRTHRLAATTCMLLAALTVAAGSAGAQQDLRSPDARDAARSSSLAGTTTTAAGQDLRSPDTRDAAERRAPIVVHVERSSDASISWDSIAVGALIGAGLMLSVAGAYVLVGRRRTHGPHVA